MAISRQYSLFTKGPLFEKATFRRYLDEMRAKHSIMDLADRINALAQWVDALGKLASKKTRAKETSLEQEFNQRVLVQVLGYTLFPASEATAYVKPPTSLTRTHGEPDVLLGRFSDAPSSTQLTAVLELKAPNTPLDLPQARESHETPVEQAFGYARSILGVRWVLVSDMRQIRLYSVDPGYIPLVFDLEACVRGASAEDRFRELYFLLHHDFLCAGGPQAPIARLLDKGLSAQYEVHDSFYSIYYEIRSDLFASLQEAVTAASPPIKASKDELLSATQRLLDRMLFIFYCESAPDALIEKGTVERTVKAGLALPGRSPAKVYGLLKDLFREIDEGSPATSGLQLPAYNGELFKPHPILDAVDLPDSLARKIYQAPQGPGLRRVEGAWGLYGYDFWRELNEHLLGHVFEESLSDMIQLTAGTPVPLHVKLAERKRHGIYYTSQILSDHLATGALKAFLDEAVGPSLKRKPATEADLIEVLKKRRDHLTQLRIADLSCGSGAFLVSAYHGLLQEYYRSQEAISELEGGGRKTPQAALVEFAQREERKTNAVLLRYCLYGCDLLPQAVEIAKLALWLRSARKGERVADLGQNIVCGNSLDVQTLFKRMNVKPGSFDLVLGNPPWGADLPATLRRSAATALGLDKGREWDSWELFVVLSLYALKPGGRLALVLPDTILSPEKAEIRELLLRQTTLEKFHNLGPDWFGTKVRMGTVVLQARKGPSSESHDFDALLLYGDLRRQAFRGEVPLPQAEARFTRRVPQERSLDSPSYDIELFRSREDDRLMNAMDMHSEHLREVCERGRGEEMSKSGLLWRCPSCQAVTPPGEKRKGGGYHDKTCPTCGLTLTEANAKPFYMVEEGSPRSSKEAPFVDGDDLIGRYTRLEPHKRFKLGVAGWDYKEEPLYKGPKLLLRQAGVGVAATCDFTDARFPQSVYFYRVNPERAEAGLTNEFVLAALLSRAMAFYVFKRFGEVDPAKAMAKLTHERLATLPIPRVDFENKEERGTHDAIAAHVRRLLSGKSPLGGPDDQGIELKLRSLWGLSPEDGQFINDELRTLPEGQIIRELFPK